MTEQELSRLRRRHNGWLPSREQIEAAEKERRDALYDAAAVAMDRYTGGDAPELEADDFRIAQSSLFD